MQNIVLYIYILLATTLGWNEVVSTRINIAPAYSQHFNIFQACDHCCTRAVCYQACPHDAVEHLSSKFDVLILLVDLMAGKQAGIA